MLEEGLARRHRKGEQDALAHAVARTHFQDTGTAGAIDSSYHSLIRRHSSELHHMASALVSNMDSADGFARMSKSGNPPLGRS